MRELIQITLDAFNSLENIQDPNLNLPIINALKDYLQSVDTGSLNIQSTTFILDQLNTYIKKAKKYASYSSPKLVTLNPKFEFILKLLLAPSVPAQKIQVPVTLFKAFNNPERYKKQYRKLLTNLELRIVCSEKTKKSAKIFKGYNLLYYIVSSKERKTLARVIACRNPEKYNLFSALATFKPKLPSINFHQLVYIPRIFAHFLDQKGLNERVLHYTQLIKQEPTIAGSKFSLRMDSNNRRIPVRILSPRRLFTVLDPDTFLCLCGHRPSLEEICLFDSLILHFTGFSSEIDQSYTRLWAKALNSPVLSVDYRAVCINAVDDAWQIYNWLLYYAEKHLSILPSKVVLVGDSLGGSVALSLMSLASQERLCPIRGLLLNYPILSHNTHYSRSLLYGLEDRLAPSYIFEGLSKKYAGDLDPLGSVMFPTFESNAKIRILVGEKDPVFDDCLTFAAKTKESGVDVAMVCYQEGVHGMLNMHMIPECKSVVDESIACLKELFS